MFQYAVNAYAMQHNAGNRSVSFAILLLKLNFAHNKIYGFY